MEKKTKAIGLFSGGLDSIMAAKILQEQGIDVILFNFTTVFFDRAFKESVRVSVQKAAEAIEAPLNVVDVSAEYIGLVKKPKHGYGRRMNPCIDCRIFMLRKAKELMEKEGASFVFTGEILGQRPLSQRREAMNLIEDESGLKGYLLRPLSARLFPATKAEEEKIVDRQRLMSMSGRSRKPQIALAKRFGITDYPTSGGGCLLTNEIFAQRLKDLMRYKPDFSTDDVELLKHGRHFRISSELKLVVGRDSQENYRIAALKKDIDIMFHAQEPLGPVSILRGRSDGEDINEAASIIARYTLGKGKTGEVKIKYFKCDKDESFIRSNPCDESLVENRRI